MYSAVVLDKESQQKLIAGMFDFMAPIIADVYGSPMASWEPVSHHMTMKMGSLTGTPWEVFLGTEAILEAYEFAYDDKVIAVKVSTDVPSKNKVKHVTCFVNRENGGKPFLSNNLTNWTELPSPIKLSGVVEEVK